MTNAAALAGHCVVLAPPQTSRPGDRSRRVPRSGRGLGAGVPPPRGVVWGARGAPPAGVVRGALPEGGPGAASGPPGAPGGPPGGPGGRPGGPGGPPGAPGGPQKSGFSGTGKNRPFCIIPCTKGGFFRGPGSVPTGRVIKYPRKCAKSGPPGGAGGPPGPRGPWRGPRGAPVPGPPLGAGGPPPLGGLPPAWRARGSSLPGPAPYTPGSRTSPLPGDRPPPERDRVLAGLEVGLEVGLDGMRQARASLNVMTECGQHNPLPVGKVHDQRDFACGPLRGPRSVTA